MRGAALVETAFTLTFLLGFLFGSVQLGFVGYYTLLTDYAAQTNARFTSFDIDRDQGIALLRQSVDNLKESRVRFSYPMYGNSVPIDTESMDFNFADANNRTGGFEFVAPMQTVAAAASAQDLLHIGNIPVNVESVAVEPLYSLVCYFYCADLSSLTNQVSNGNNFNKSTWYYFGAENPTPFYLLFVGIKSCGGSATADLSAVAWQEWDACPAGRTVSRGLGLAGHLDITNSFYTLPGERLDPSYSGLQTLAPQPSQAGPFFASWCHRRIYSRIDAEALLTQPDVPNSALESKAFLQKLFGADASGNPKVGSIIYSNPSSFKSQSRDITLTDWGSNLPQPFYDIVGGFPMNSVLTGDSGWDATITQDNNTPGVTIDGTTSPWWGCGLR